MKQEAADTPGIFIEKNVEKGAYLFVFQEFVALHHPDFLLPPHLNSSWVFLAPGSIQLYVTAAAQSAIPGLSIRLARVSPSSPVARASCILVCSKGSRSPVAANTPLYQTQRPCPWLTLTQVNQIRPDDNAGWQQLEHSSAGTNVRLSELWK